MTHGPEPELNFDRSLRRTPVPVRGCGLGIYGHVSLIHGPEWGQPSWGHRREFQPGAFVAFAERVKAADTLPDMVMFDWEGFLDEQEFAACVATTKAFRDAFGSGPRPKVAVYGGFRAKGMPSACGQNEYWVAPQRQTELDAEPFDSSTPRWLAGMKPLLDVTDAIVGGSALGDWSTAGRDILSGAGMRRQFRAAGISEPFYSYVTPAFSGGGPTFTAQQLRSVLSLTSCTNVDGIVVWGGTTPGHRLLKQALRAPL